MMASSSRDGVELVPRRRPFLQFRYNARDGPSSSAGRPDHRGEVPDDAVAPPPPRRAPSARHVHADDGTAVVRHTELVVERRPTLSDWENSVERQIREGIERGEFDSLPGAGKPLAGLDGPHDEEWWVKEKLRREKVSQLPPALAVRKELEVALERIAAATSEVTVRRIVTEINERIVHVNSHTTSGPPSTLMPLDVELVLQRWTVARPGVQ
jgi:hypothetical protein